MLALEFGPFGKRHQSVAQYRLDGQHGLEADNRRAPGEVMAVVYAFGVATAWLAFKVV